MLGTTWVSPRPQIAAQPSGLTLDIIARGAINWRQVNLFTTACDKAAPLVRQYRLPQHPTQFTCPLGQVFFISESFSCWKMLSIV